MRLRLRIERNEIPAVSVLWAVGDTEQKQTIAQFLARVNERFPIESPLWGYEDYNVTVGGYEVLHYDELASVFQNEDEVLIKPLSKSERRARWATGRDQIARDGRHMIDGVPWGKPCLKRPMRMEVDIPPRKKQKTGDGNKKASLHVHFPDQLEDDDDEDMDFEPGANDSESDDSNDEEEDQTEGGEAEMGGTEPRVSRRTTRSTALRNGTFAGLDPEEELAEDSEDDTSSEDESDSSEDDSSSDDSSDDSSSDSESEASWNGIDTDAPAGQQTPTSSSESQTNIITAKVAPVKKAPSAPFEGKSETQARNSRRRDQRKLKLLKQYGVLPCNATLTDMAAMSKEEIDLQIKKHKLLQKFNSSSQPEVEAAADSAPRELQQARAALDEAQNLMDTAMNGSSGISDGAASANAGDFPQVNGETSLLNGDGGDIEETAEDEPPEIEPTVPSKRKRLDLAGTNRLVFGSLGVRTPKSQVEKDALQKKLTDRAKQFGLAKKPAASRTSQVQPPADDEDPDALLDKVELSAVECVDEGVELSTPPFPFVQRWDPQYQYKSTTKRQKKRKTNVNGANGVYVETYDKYNTDGSGDALNYDDPEDEDEDFGDDSYWEEGALLDDTPDEDIEAEKIQDDGFPTLPTDVSTLPTLAEADAQQGDYVIFNELGVSAATGWQPGTITRTVRLESKNDDGWTVKVAQRDMRPKKYNEEGTRVYQKFEMEGLSEDEDDDGEKTLHWGEMQEPRLLQRAATD